MCTWHAPTFVAALQGCTTVDVCSVSTWHRCDCAHMDTPVCVEALHDMPQGARRITPHPQDSQATDRVRDQSAESQRRVRESTGARSGGEMPNRRRKQQAEQGARGTTRPRHTREEEHQKQREDAQPQSGTRAHNRAAAKHTLGEGATSDTTAPSSRCQDSNSPGSAHMPGRAPS